MVKIIFLTVSSGFSNRMLPILSCYTWCKEHKIPLAVIWFNRTHRAGVKRVENGKYFNLKNYFDEIPDLINVFSNFNEAAQHYGVSGHQVHHHNMNWSKSFDLNLLKVDYLHLMNCCFLISLYPEYQNIIGNRCDLPKEMIENYPNHPYIKKVSENFQEFKLNKLIVETGKKIFFPELVGIQLRNTDGGFTENDNNNVVQKLYKLIESHDNVFFSNDNIVNYKDVVEKYPNVVTYNDMKKFINNDEGTFYCLVDFYIMSQCKTTYVASMSSFTLLAFLYNTNKDKKMYYWCY